MDKPFRNTAKDVFSYLLAIVTLYMGVISFLTLTFQYINVQFPDVLRSVFEHVDALNIIRQSMSVLFVSWPVFIFISWTIYRDMKRESEKGHLGIRKWLLYLTLFVTSLTIIIDLITLINYFLNGEVTVRFLLKVVMVLAVAASVFGYYLWDLRRDVNKKTWFARFAAISTSVAAVGVIVLGFVVVGLPSTQRFIRLDAERVNDLSTIQQEIIHYYSLKQSLPETLDTLNNSLTGFVVPTDPFTQAAYEYRVMENLTFEVCATFDTEFTEDRPTYPVYGDFANQAYWDHGAGRFCFSRTIDPDLYPPESVVKEVPLLY